MQKPVFVLACVLGVASGRRAHASLPQRHESSNSFTDVSPRRSVKAWEKSSLTPRGPVPALATLLLSNPAASAFTVGSIPQGRSLNNPSRAHVHLLRDANNRVFQYVPVMSMGDGPPISTGDEPSPAPAPASAPATSSATDDDLFDFGDAPEIMAKEDEDGKSRGEEIKRLMAKEVFVKKPTGDAICQTCGYRYRKDEGDGFIPKGTPFQKLPEDWVCVKCNSPKPFFKALAVEVAGFEENQQYGIGTNQLTEDQKTLVIFGGLGLFFILLLGGYALN